MKIKEGGEEKWPPKGLVMVKALAAVARKENAAALAGWRQLGAAQKVGQLALQRPVRLCLTAPLAGLSGVKARLRG